VKLTVPQIAAVALSVAALVISLIPPQGGTAYWVTVHPVSEGARITRQDVAAVAIAGQAPPSALKESHPVIGKKLGSSLPKDSFILPSDLRAKRALNHTSATVDVAIPVPSLATGLRTGGRAVILSWGSGPPVILAREIPIVGTRSGVAGSSVSVALPLPEAEAVTVAEGSEKVAVLPWTP